MATPVYHRVRAASGASAPEHYEERFHRRVDDLVEEWLATPAAARISGGGFRESHGDDVDRCRQWVTAAYEQRYGRSGVGALPVIGILIWPVLCGIISWIVQRTLDEMFPRPGAVGNDHDD